MATKESKGKKGKENDKKSGKKSEEPSLSEEKKDETLSPSSEENSPEGQTPVVEVPVEPPKIPTPEPVYEEPILPKLIIECFEGELVKGQYDGECSMVYKGGHSYKGQFSEGLMNGKGKYIWADGVTYEGDFVNNVITGKGIYTWTDGSWYEGDVEEGKRHGDGTFRCPHYQVSYVGEWINGKRNGKGRMEYDGEGKSFYDGDWLNNIKHGWGLRQYPSGNVYQGMWFNNVRHGEGSMKWIDKDQIYTGQWENGIQHGMGQHIWLLRRNHSSQYPLRNMYDGEFVNGLRHGFGSFRYANGALYEGYWKNNMKHGKVMFVIMRYKTSDVMFVIMRYITSDVMFVIMRYITSIKKIYTFYSNLGHDESLDNIYIMNKMQFWRFLKDCQLHHFELTLMDMDRIIGKNYHKATYELHNPFEKILQRQFINYLIILAYHTYHEQMEEDGPILSWCMSKLITENVLQNACNVHGFIYIETRRANNALVHLDQAYEVYQSVSSPRKHKPKEPALKMRQYLFMMKDLKLINNDLDPQAVIRVLSSDDPSVDDSEGCYNLELEMTFLEFFEALIGCAEIFVTEAVVKDPATPRPSTALTQDQSMYSIPVAPSRLTSHAGVEDGVESAQATPNLDNSSGMGTPTRAQSSAATTNKTAENSHKTLENQASSNNLISDTGIQGLQDSSKDIQDLGEQQKSASFVSTQTTGTEDNAQLIQSTVSIGGHTEIAIDDTDRISDGENEEEEELDEATRRFNFWTHQIHIFFVRKFFPAAERMSVIRTAISCKMLEEARQRSVASHY
ncbi:hypothetical protein LOTGIDRAFT_233146 [Lottia gigantea]|uniref:Radial spoke head 10 homolog B2 n=1 Tax=Lottia gigantea TaxID=225164 RepID=V4BTV1_LOTGI|nr:hypothetical protein LOTGIDRAFT_233146 [Lottia gigantea]ESO92384.1 hypothetical protein LOTGIDRAFT_233146 [Lottia gigantea]